MDNATQNATAEQPAIVKPYDTEPDHITAARDQLKEANRVLNAKLRALENFQEVYGSDSDHYKEALAQVHAAQELANNAAHVKSFKSMEHGLERAKDRITKARENIAQRVSSGNWDNFIEHARELTQAEISHADITQRLADRSANPAVQAALAAQTTK